MKDNKRCTFFRFNITAVTLIFTMLLSGCGGMKNKQSASLAVPSINYLINSNETSYKSFTAKDWIEIAKSNYAVKKYARALRAATIALSMNEHLDEAKEIAMLSVVKVTQNNIGSYHESGVFSANEKAEFRRSLSDITSLIGIAN